MFLGGQSDPGASGGDGQFKPIATQAEFDERIKDRLERQKKQFDTQISELSGKVKGVEDMQKELATLRENERKRDEDKLTAEEKLKKQHERELAAERVEREKATKAAQESTVKFQNFLRQTALTAAAARANAIDPDQIYILLRDRVKVGDDEKVLFEDEDGAEIKIDEGVKNYLAKNPHLVKNPGGGGGGGSRPGGGTGEQLTIGPGGKILLNGKETTREERTKLKPQIDALVESQRKK